MSNVNWMEQMRRGSPSAWPRWNPTMLSAAEIHRGWAQALAHQGEPGFPEIVRVYTHFAYCKSTCSLGVQSLNDDLLRSVTRRSRPLDEVKQLVRAAQSRGLVVNLDLMLGLPGQTAESFRSDVLRLCSVAPDVITLYIYQPVIRHPEAPPDHMAYTRAVTPELLEQVAEAGYETDRPVDAADICLQLVPKGTARTRSLAGYSLFEEDDLPSNLIGLGSGAYGHLYGYGWFRDVTPLATMSEEDGTCSYWGTRLTVEDEIRQTLRSALHSGFRAVDLGLIARQSGMDPRTAFAETLAFAERHGLSRYKDDVFQPLPNGDPERKRELIDRLFPVERPPVPTPIAPDAAVQRELVTIGSRASSGKSNEALVRAFRKALDIPDVGRRWLGAIVRLIDPRSVSFGVELPPRAPLRIHVQPTGTRPSFVDNGRFAITYAQDPSGPLTPNERRFLAALSAVLKSGTKH